jgi:hypothetical protein
VCGCDASALGQTELGPSGTYWLFAALGVVAIGSIYYTLPETKGKTLEQIEAEFAQRRLR